MELNDYTAPAYRWELRYSNGWFNGKRKLKEKAGIQININYSSMFLGATAKKEDGLAQHAASGILDATVKVDLLNRKKEKNKGSLIVWTDWRHLYYGEIAPQFLNLETGAANLGAVKFNKWSYRILLAYYQQELFNGRAGFIAGKIDLTDWFSFSGLLHPMLHFMDLGFSVNPTISWSNAGLGLGAGGWLDKKKRFALVAGFNDVTGENYAANNFLDWGARQWKNGNFLKIVEFQYTPSRAKWYTNRFSATYWHADEVLHTEDEFFTSASSTGFALQGTWVLDDKHIPVVTFGMSDGKGANALSKLNISAMYGRYFQSHDLFGIGVNYTTSSISNENQFLTELFYRWTLSKTTSFTPVIKLLANPSLNPNVDFMIYYGIRSRISI